MELQDFLNKHGSNVQSNEAWIFVDNIKAGQYSTTVFQLVGFGEVERDGRENIPYLEVLDTASKIKMNLSVWTTDKQIEWLKIGDTFQLKLNGNKVHLDKV